MNRRQEKAARTRATIVAEARYLFQGKGYAGVGLREIAGRSQLSATALYGHFTSKAKLYEEAMGVPPPDVEGFLQGLAAGQFDVEWAQQRAGVLFRQMTGQATS